MKLAEANGAQVYHCDWRALLDVVPECDALIVDAPYSERTHAGHDDAVATGVERLKEPFVRADGRTEKPSYGTRRAISYSFWTADDVNDFCAAWAHRIAGWFVSIMDHALAPVWAEALESEGRYVFAPIPFVAPGSRVRLLGDGPSNWATWIVVARPRTKAMAKWGTLPGAYVLPSGQGGAMPVVGGKPIWLLSQLVSHYSRPGDLVVDPCCGAGTLAAAAIRAGRRSIVGDAMREHADLAAQWIANPWKPAPHLEREQERGQALLFSAK